MIELLIFSTPFILAYGLYRWLEAQDQAKRAKRSKSGKKAWATRQQHGHYLLINDCLNDTKQVVWLEG